MSFISSVRSASRTFTAVLVRDAQNIIICSKCEEELACGGSSCLCEVVHIKTGDSLGIASGPWSCTSGYA